ncbi:hypothetical protein [Burkholderia ambifaria]|uniref:Uncharacterized protein n=1 Tax=Burkholderia ambifaria MEX-5 TaxID=396597 RepID=B1TDE5_9BURK|nr:hypothetical protein [Burkholderia ambifaria]EDT38415.1 hypothetical protein BamMEX5DRAFT_5811 [Burkholderia ambifaria MEX-5]
MTDVRVPERRSGAQLREAFGAWAVPVERDFQDLIFLADIGRQALGLDENMVPPAKSPQTGLGITSGDGSIDVRLDGLGGLGRMSANAGIALTCGTGLAMGADGLTVDRGAGFDFDTRSGGLMLSMIAPLSQANEVLEIVRGAGIGHHGAEPGALALLSDPQSLRVDGTGLAIICSPGGGLTVDDQGQLTIDIESLMDL